MEDNQFEISVFPQEEVPYNAKQIGSANMLLNQLPNLLGERQLAGAYKVVIPDGVTGSLMQMKSNGLLTTSIIGESGKIAGQAGLQSLSSVANPLAVFNVASMITGQYFMAQINNSLTALTENVAQVQRQIDASEESTVYAASIFLQEMKNDWSLILSSNEMRNVFVLSALRTINEITASAYYFVNRVDSNFSEVKTSWQKGKTTEERVFIEAERNTEFLKLAYEMRSCLKVILVYLTNGISSINAEEIKAVLQNDDNLVYQSTVSQLDDRVKDLKEVMKSCKTLKQQETAKAQLPRIVRIRDAAKDSYKNDVRKNMLETIDSFALMDKRGQQFYIQGDKLLVEC